jgi:hypothetical protein
MALELTLFHWNAELDELPIADLLVDAVNRFPGNIDLQFDYVVGHDAATDIYPMLETPDEQ